MYVRKRVFALILPLVIVLGGCSFGARYERYSAYFFYTFDTEVTVSADTSGAEEFGRLYAMIETRMRELHRMYDIYNEYEGINNLRTINKNAGIQPVEVSRDII